MKVVLLPYCFYPDPMGGTEVYVTGLARELASLGVESSVVVGHTSDQTLIHHGVRVCRYAACQPSDRLNELYGEADELDSGFGRFLQTEKPDVMHIHAFSPSVSMGKVRAAKELQIPVVFTYHTPTVTCQRGTMLRWGVEPCDGLMDLHTCARCTLHGLFSRTESAGHSPAPCSASRNGNQNVPGKIFSNILGSLPPVFGSWLGRRELQGGLWTALRMSELIRLRHETTQSFFAKVDRIVAVCDWVKQVLLRNGVPEGKIALCRQGVSIEAESGKQKSETGKQLSTFNLQSSTLRLCFFGRLDPTKGIHVLIEAFRSIPQAALQLDIYGVAQGEAGKNYEQTLRRLAKGDNRIKFCSPVPATEIITTLKNYDLLAVPSQLLETGPLVVLEAFAAGVPVIGSRLGGIAELVKDGVNGILVEANSTEAWAAVLDKFSKELELVNRLRLGIQPPRTMRKVADEMLALYISILNQRSVAISP